MAWKRRQKRLANSRVQRAMIAHTALHWMLFLLGTLLLLLGWQVMFGEPNGTLSEHLERTWQRHGPAFIVLLVLMPVVVLDTLKLGCRIAGPMLRLGSALHRLAEGELVEDIRLRKQDFWQEIAADFNTLLDRLGHRAPLAGSAQTASVEEPEGHPDCIANCAESRTLTASVSD